jgi:hypothetical protein
MADTYRGRNPKDENDSRGGGNSAENERKKTRENKSLQASDTSFPESRKKDHAPKDSGSYPITEDDEDLGRHARDTQRGNTLHSSSSNDKKR